MTITDKQVEAALSAANGAFGGGAPDIVWMRAALEAAEAAREVPGYERARFEAAYKADRLAPKSFARDPDHPEEYFDGPTQSAWWGWNARSQSAPAAQGEAAEPFGWATLDKNGCTERVVSRRQYQFNSLEPIIVAGVAHDLLPYLDREDSGVAPHRLVTLYTTPQPSAPGVVSDAMVEAIDKRFRSGNSVPVERAHITATEWAVLRARGAQPSADDAPPTDENGRVHTGDPEADRIIDRLNSSDPNFDDCEAAAAWIYRKAKIADPADVAKHREMLAVAIGLLTTHGQYGVIEYLRSLQPPSVAIAASPSDAPRARPTPEMLAEFVRVYSGAEWSESRPQLTKRQLARAEKAYAAMMRIAPGAPPADARDGIQQWARAYEYVTAILPIDPQRQSWVRDPTNPMGMAEQDRHRVDLLIGERDANAEDARRYRWLRRKFCLIGAADGSRRFNAINLPQPTGVAADPESCLDVSIDRAMGGE